MKGQVHIDVIKNELERLQKLADTLGEKANDLYAESKHRGSGQHMMGSARGFYRAQTMLQNALDETIERLQAHADE